MNAQSSVVAPAIVLVAVLASACDGHSPSAPSPAPSPAPDLSRLLGLWNITVRLTAASGGGCVGETMQSQVGMPKSYSLLIAQNVTKVDVTLTSASGDYACTFTGGSADSSGFSFGPSEGYYSCERGDLIRGFRCANGMLRDIVSLGQNLFGRVSGTEISGTWDVSWVLLSDDGPGVETRAQFTGRRQ